MIDHVYELDGLAIGMAASSLGRNVVSSAAREIEKLRDEIQQSRTEASRLRMIIRKIADRAHTDPGEAAAMAWDEAEALIRSART